MILRVKSSPVELRGLADRRNATTGKTYYILNVEDVNDGSPLALYCPNPQPFISRVKKGDIVSITFEVRFYHGNERMMVVDVEKWENVE